MKPTNIILEGITGSKAYGLDHIDSDEDTLGVFVEPTINLLGLQKPQESIVTTNPDVTLHEVGKFIRLALAANPTILEMLFLEDYTSLNYFGKRLVEKRDAFLSQRVRNTYFGYAQQQMTRLQNRNDGSFQSKLRNRYEKHARHCARLLFQGRDLLETGTLTVQVSNRDEIFAIGKMSPEELLAWFEGEKDKFNKVESVLPLEPDFDLIEEELICVRMTYLDSVKEV